MRNPQLFVPGHRLRPIGLLQKLRGYLAGNTLSGGTTTRGSTDKMTRNLRFGASDEDRAIADRVAKSPRVSACRASVALGLVLGEETAKFLEEPYRAKPVTGHE